jgi:MFS family permease
MGWNLTPKRSTRTVRPFARGSERLGGYFLRIGSFRGNARLYLIGAFLMGIGHGALWVHMNLYYRALGLGEEMIGRILSAGSFGTVLMAIPAALFIDRAPASRVFGIAAVGFAATLGIQLLVSNPWVLAGASCLGGMAFTIHWVAAAPFFMRNSREDDRIYLFGVAHAFETTATILAAVGVGSLYRLLALRSGSELFGLRWSLLVVAAVSLSAVAAFSRIDSRPPRIEAKGLREYLSARDWVLLGKLVFPSAMVGFGAGLIIPFLNLYFRERFGQDPLQIGTVFAVSQFFMVLGFLAGPPIARRLGIVLTVVSTELLSIPFFLLLAFTRSLPVAILAFWVRGALMNMNHPLVTNFAMEMVTSDQQAVTNSVRMLAWNISWMVSTQLGGWIIERQGFTTPMLITIVLYATSSLLLFRFFRGFLAVGRAVRSALAAG